MEIKIDAAIVGRALRALDSFVSSATNSTANALRMYAEDGTLRLERNDYETIVSYDTEIPVPSIADIYIPAILTGSILRSVAGVIAMEIEEKAVSFGHSRGHFSVKSITEVNWPKPESIEAVPLGVDSTVFARALAQVEVSVSTDKYRPNLSGAHVENRDGYIVLSSTDSYRMSQVTIPGTVSFTGILPGTVVHGLTGYLSGEDSRDVSIGVDEMSAQVVAGKLSVTTRLVNASFPDFTTVLSKAESNENIIVAPRKELVDILRQAMILLDKENPRVTVDVTVNGKEAAIYVDSSSDQGDAENYVYGEVKGGDSFSIRVNPAYLIAGLDRFDDEVVSFSSSGSGRSACTLTSDSDGFVYLFMPYSS
jgi:DNA polymerase III sliding clamp (beta) subunit (PCNA family)